MAKLLVIRFSALGDVAMTIPVLYALALQYSQLDITVLSRSAYQPLFAGLPSNIHFVSADLSGRHKNIGGLNQLLNDIDYKTFDYVADLHDVLRTKWLRWRLKLLGKKVAFIHKGRIEKKALIRRTNKHFQQLPTSFERYANVFFCLEFPVNLTTVPKCLVASSANFDLVKQADTHWIGIAPFAKHTGKIYPLDKMEQVIALLAKKTNILLFLFGAGKKEIAILENWAQKHANTVSVAGKYTLDYELKLMEQLDVMLSMDSANMHLASLMDVPVVSVWGATHPFAGFMGWKQNTENCVQLDMPCRPCSIYGNKLCQRGDYACLQNITPTQIVEKIDMVLK